jgi:hypothetical protein
MTQKQKMHYALLAGIVVALGIYFVHVYITTTVAAQTEKTRLALDVQVAEQELLLDTIADLTRSNGADEVSARIIVDCDQVERTRFNTLLNALSATISQTELVELSGLFFKCGSFSADRKAVMATRLVREVTVYEEYVNLRSGLIATTPEQADRVSKWKQIAESELQLAEHFNKLVELQGDIIDALLSGKSRTSPEIIDTLTRVTETRDQMTVLTKQIDNLKSSLEVL